METLNPLADSAPTDPGDLQLVTAAQGGDRAALESLIARHRRWIYNIALRMLYHRDDAEDVTQEVLIKAITKLDSFAARSSFRTWLYRIAVNHVLNMKRRKAEGTLTFTSYAEGLNGVVEEELPDPNTLPATTSSSSTRRASAALPVCCCASTASSGSSTCSAPCSA